MIIKKEKSPLEKLEGKDLNENNDKTVEEIYLNDVDLYESFYKMIYAESGLVYDIDELITEYGYFSATDNMSQETLLKMFKLMFKIRKNASIISEAIGAAQSCLRKDSETLRTLKEQLVKYDNENK